jgi:hypothetical protein
MFSHRGFFASPDSLFRDFVAYWLEDIDLEDRISKTTRNLYERMLPKSVCMDNRSWVGAHLVLFSPLPLVRSGRTIFT